MNLKKNTLLFAILIVAASLTAQTYSIPNFSIDTIEVQTNRIPLPLKQTGKSITILDAKTIQAIPAQSIDDILNYIPGVEVQSRGGFGTQADISMRGSTFTQVLILLDGMRLNDPLTSHFNGNLPVTKSEISRIEVVRGAASSAYGADAVGGVINIITKAFSNKEEDENIHSCFQLGSNKLVDMDAGFFQKSNKLSISGGVHFAESDGELIQGNENVDDFNTFFDIKTVGLAAKYKFSNKWQLNARSSFDSRHFNARYYYTTSTFDQSVETVKNYWNHLRVANINDNSSTNIDFAHKYTSDLFVFSPEFPSTNSHTTQFYNFQVNHNRSLNDQFLLNAGVQVDRRTIESNDRGDHEDNHFGLYSSLNYSPIQSFNVLLSARLDQDANFGLEFSPQLNATYQVNNLSFRTSIGKSIRAADYTERFVSNNLENLTPGRSLGNPDLLAEESWNFELGVDLKAGKNLFVQTTLFSRISDQLIDYISTLSDNIPSNSNLSVGENYFFATNVSNVHIRGVELSLSNFTELTPRLALRSSLGYTYIKSSNEEDVLSVYISSHANHNVNAQLSILNPRFTLNLTGLYKDRTPLAAEAIGQFLEEDFFLMNVGFTHILAKNLDLSVNVYNLWDTQYQNILGAPMPGRWWAFGFKVNL